MTNYQIFYTTYHRVAKKAGQVAIEGEASSKLDLLLSEIKKGTELEGVDFSDIDFTGATIKNAILYNCEFPQLKNVTFSGGINSSRLGHGATNCKFIDNIDVASLSLLGEVSKCDFSGAILKGSNTLMFEQATVNDCSFTGFKMGAKSLIQFSNSTINNSNFSAMKNLRIDSADATFNNCDFSKSIITGFYKRGSANAVNNPIIDKTKNKSGETIDFLGESLTNKRIMLFEEFISSRDLI